MEVPRLTNRLAIIWYPSDWTCEDQLNDDNEYDYAEGVLGRMWGDDESVRYPVAFESPHPMCFTSTSRPVVKIKTAGFSRNFMTSTRDVDWLIQIETAPAGVGGFIESWQKGIPSAIYGHLHLNHHRPKDTHVHKFAHLWTFESAHSCFGMMNSPSSKRQHQTETSWIHFQVVDLRLRATFILSIHRLKLDRGPW